MTIQEIKQLLYAYRNGVVADSLRKSGDPHYLILGLIIPQISQVAALIGSDSETAKELWNCKSSRECRLLATMVHPIESFNEDLSKQWLDDCQNTEEIDILCLKLIGRAQFAVKLFKQLCTDYSDSTTSSYKILRLATNLISRNQMNSDDILKIIPEQILTSEAPTIKDMLYQIQNYE